MSGNAAPFETPRPKKKRRAGKHAQDASQLRSVSSTVKRNTISAGPRFVRRDPNASLPFRQQQMDPKDLKRNRGPQKGIFLRKTNSQEFDHAGMKAPECEAAAAGNCQLYCCNGHARLSAEEQREEVITLRDLARTARMEGSKKDMDNFYLSCIHGRHELKGKGSGLGRSIPFRPRDQITPAQGFCPGGCMWCNTVPDPDGELGDAVTLARDHRWGPKCPRVDEGKAYLETRSVGNARFMLPPARDGGKKREVTRSFFQSLFILSMDKMTSLHKQRKKADPVTKPATGAGAGSGKHGNRRRLSEEDKTRLDKVIMKFVSDAQDHYARQESLGDTVVLEQGVTRREIWWDFCGLFDKPFWEQCTRMKHRWGFDQHPPKLEEYAKDSAEKLTALRPLPSRVRAHQLASCAWKTARRCLPEV